MDCWYFYGCQENAGRVEGGDRGGGLSFVFLFLFFFFFSKNAALGLGLGLELALVSTLTLKHHSFEKKIDPDPDPAFYWHPFLYVNSSSFWNQLNQHFIARTSCPQLDIGFLLSETPHWSGTSSIIYHIFENNGESAEDEWALISTSEDVVPRTFIFTYLCLVRPTNNFISTSEILRIMYLKIVKNCFKVHFIYQRENKVLSWIDFFIFSFSFYYK